MRVPILLAIACASAHAAPSPVTLVPKPFTPVEFTTTTTRLKTGKVRFIRDLKTIGTVDDFHWDNPRRMAVGTPTGWKLVDPMTDRVIANIPHPDRRLSANELVVGRYDNFEAIASLDTGAILRPMPRVPISAPVERVTIISSREGGGDVFLKATAGGRSFVGLWNDRAASPLLPYEVDIPGWSAHRREEGLELTTPVSKSCKGYRLHRTRPPECRTTYDFHRTAITGTWEVDLDDKADGTYRLTAHDQTTGRDEVVDIPCSDAWLAGSPTAPRVLVECMRDRPDQPLAFAWTPGHAYVVSGLPGERVTGHSTIGGTFSFAGLLHDPSAYWLDLDAGMMMHGPRLDDLDADESAKPIAVSGKGAATQLMVVDGRTLRPIKAPCAGEILLDTVSPRYTALSCGIRTQPGVFDFRHVWTKVIDVQSLTVFDMPSYVTGIFDDGTAILSNRTRLTAETRGPNARLTLVSLSD